MRTPAAVVAVVLAVAVALPVDVPAHAAPVAPPSTGAMAVAVSTSAASGVTAQAKKKVHLRFATFNVRTARADRRTSRRWLNRVGRVARTIAREKPHVVTLQELGPGRADGKKAKLRGAARQTSTLLTKLHKVGGKRYRLTRTTAYVRPGTKHGTQGTRILYDAKRLKLLSSCRQTTANLNYNGSCSMNLPRLHADSASKTRSAAYAGFRDRRTHRKFFVVSVHLDPRHSKKAAREHKYDVLRRKQARSVYRRMVRRAHGHVILFGGDLNSWKTKAGSNAPYDFMMEHGFHSTATAKTRVHGNYPTVNHFHRVLTPKAPGRQVALDQLLIRGGSRFYRYENRMQVKDSHRPSDHNMVIGDLRW